MEARRKEIPYLILLFLPAWSQWLQLSDRGIEFRRNKMKVRRGWGRMVRRRVVGLGIVGQANSFERWGVLLSLFCESTKPLKGRNGAVSGYSGRSGHSGGPGYSGCPGYPVRRPDVSGQVPAELCLV
ncbi:hypothetical protein BGX38DRAFT_1190398 [Terfezia claveryi]|nr:hypothetical protein BGX38DRAFT_1190398 [Terfezia claveryi]